MLRTPHPSIVFDDFATSSPTGEGILKVIATSVAVGQLPQVADFSTSEPIGSACGMPQGGLCKPPARLVVMTNKYNLSAICQAYPLGAICLLRKRDITAFHAVAI